MIRHIPTIEHTADYRNRPNDPIDTSRGFPMYAGTTEVMLEEGYADFEVSYDGESLSLRVGYGSHAGSAGLDLNDARILRSLLSDAIADMERRQAWWKGE